MNYLFAKYTEIPGFAQLNAGDTFTIGTTGGLIAPNFALTAATNAFGIEMRVAGELYVNEIKLRGSDIINIAASGIVASNYEGSTFQLGAGSYFNNAGQVTGAQNAAAISLSGGGTLVINSGSITGELGVALGFDLSGGDQLTNSGYIFGRTAVLMSGGDETILNTGTIEGGVFGSAIYVQGEVFSGGAWTTTSQHITNLGQLIGSKVAISVELEQVGSGFFLNNSGTIAAEDTAVASSSVCVDRIINTGTITGGINLNSGNDTLNSAGGTINGIVDLGGGDDTFDIRGGHLNGIVYGSSGADTYYVDSQVSLVESGTDMDAVYAATDWRLGDNFEILTLLEAGNFNGSGNNTANLLIGNSGDNRLTGLGGRDTLYGDMGDDRVIGGADNDSCSGDDGDDWLLGGLGNDTLRGETGDDTLIGGAGNDALFGGAGFDCFVLAAVKHSGTNSATADAIFDFTQGEDLIDLSKIDANRGNTLANDAFTFVVGALTNVAGQLNTRQLSGETYVQIDVNGDALADAVIRISGLFTLNAGDFIL